MSKIKILRLVRGAGLRQSLGIVRARRTVRGLFRAKRPLMFEGPRVYQPLYRIFHLGEDDRIARAEVVEAASDADALAESRRRATTHAVELWDRGRFVARIEAAGEPGVETASTP